SLTVTLSGLPEGATLSAGTHNSDGSWTLSGDQLTGLTLIPTQNSGEDFTLTVTATTHNALTGTEASVAASLPVTVVDTVATPIVKGRTSGIPTIIASSLSVSAEVGLENGSIPLDIVTGYTNPTGT